MKGLLSAIFLSALFIFTASSAEALTIRNKCKFPVAGSVFVAESMVNVAQFRLIPGQTKKLLKGFNKTELIIRTIPDVYDLSKLQITTTTVNTPDSHIELKYSDKGIKFKVH